MDPRDKGKKKTVKKRRHEMKGHYDIRISVFDQRDEIDSISHEHPLRYDNGKKGKPIFSFHSPLESCENARMG